MIKCMTYYIHYIIFTLENAIIYVIKVRKRAKIMNQYNQAPHLTQDTNGKVNIEDIQGKE